VGLRWERIRRCNTTRRLHLPKAGEPHCYSGIRGMTDGRDFWVRKVAWGYLSVWMASSMRRMVFRAKDKNGLRWAFLSLVRNLTQKPATCILDLEKARNSFPKAQLISLSNQEFGWLNKVKNCIIIIKI
jgi:hypothetical protein